MMGGIVTDLDARSTLPGLYAVGESSCTGLHGANRLASNSLSECFVFARRAVAHALATPRRPRAPERARRARRAARARRATARATRDARGAVARRGHRAHRGGAARLLEDPHPLARLIARCALAREESRGAHLRGDHPERDPALDHRHAVVGRERRRLADLALSSRRCRTVERARAVSSKKVGTADLYLDPFRRASCSWVWKVFRASESVRTAGVLPNHRSER